MTLPPHIGEVIAASTTFITAECARSGESDGVANVPDPPAFGSFVRIGNLTGQIINVDSALAASDDPFELPSERISKSLPASDAKPSVLYGVVVFAECGAREPGRPVTAYGLDDDELRRSQPQIYELLASRFSAVLIAYAAADGVVRPYLPPRPPRPHSRVWPVTIDETRRLTERLDYLRPIIASGGSAGGAVTYPVDELIAALLKNAYLTAHSADEAFLLRAGRALAALLPMEYDRLRAIVERIIG